MKPLKNIIDVEGLEDLKPGTGIEVGDTKYEYASELSTDGVPLIDPGTGKTIAIRVFTFKINPEKVKEINKVNKQLIFNNHVKQITTILWGDGLRPLEEVAPRVIINKRKGIYQIFVACEARLNTVWGEKPNNLSELLNGKLEPKDK